MDEKMLPFDAFIRREGQKFMNDATNVEQFSLLKTDQERISYILPKIQEGAAETAAMTTPRYSKDSVAADRCLQGALLAVSDPLHTHSLGRALRLCNNAVRFAPAYSPLLTRAYALRVSILTQLCFYQEALKDCQILSSDTKMNEELKCKIYLAQAACLAGLQDWDGAEGCLRAALVVLRDDGMPKEQKAALAMQLASQMKTLRLRRLDVSVRARVSLPPTPALMSAPHASIPNACDAIEMRFTPEKGRYLVANRNIEPGSVLIVDQPYAWMTVPPSWHDHCANCCRPVLSSVPCTSCSAVCYCDEACRDAAWSEFHRWECGILEHFAYSKELSTMALLVIRVVTRAGLNTLSETHFSDDAYSNVFLQQTNESLRPVADMLKRTLTAVFLEKCLEITGFCSNAHGTLVASMLLRHLQSCSCNAYEITENLDIGDRNEDVTIGGAVYSTISLANHSCNNNVVRNSYGRNCVVRALRLIKDGEEISDNYGYSFLSCKQQERSVELKRQYFFICDCEACSNQWPLFSQLANKSEFKCPRCQSILNRPPCTTCYSKKEAKSIDRQFSEIPAVYQRAVQKLAAKDIENCILLAQKGIQFLCAWVIQPNKELIKWQQVLLRCWSLCGSINNLIFSSEDNNQ